MRGDCPPPLSHLLLIKIPPPICPTLNHVRINLKMIAAIHYSHHFRPGKLFCERHKRIEAAEIVVLADEQQLGSIL